MLDFLCRFCGKKSVKTLNYIFEEATNAEGPTLLQKITSCIPITVNKMTKKTMSDCSQLKFHAFDFQINEDDHLPKRLCAKCLDETNNVYDFIQLILETQKTFAGDNEAKIGIVEDDTDDGRRRTRAATKQNQLTLDCDPFECVTITEKPAKTKYQETTTELEIDLIPTESTHTGAGKRLNEDVSNALKKLKSVARNLTVSRTTAKKAECQMVPAAQCSQIDNESSSDVDNGDSEFEGDESKSVSSISLESETDTDDDEFRPRNRKHINSSNKPYTNNATKKDENLVVYKISSPPVFLCLKCENRFPTFAALKVHINGDNECKRASLTCEICNKVLKNRKALHGHVKGHEQKTSLVCDQCGKVYTNQFNLENHKSAQHGEYVQEHGNIYRCQMCEAKFDNRTDLYTHITNHEKAPVTVLCDTCGKSFNSNKALQTHIRTHLNIRPYACTYCQKRFAKRLHLTQHLHIHTGIKTFKCTMCEKAFAKKDSLIAHRRKHTGETPYECSSCPQKYSNLNQLKTHLKSHPLNEYDGDMP